MTDLKGRLGEAVRAAFAAEGLPEDLGRVGVSDRPDLADFQSNGALAASKVAKANPREIAARVAARLEGDARLQSVEVAGPGFVNLTVSEAALTDRAREIAADPRLGAERVAAPRRVVVDYAGPNVAKPMHVGHLRASIIGEAIKRLFRFRGDQVWGDAHFGDWGFQMGLLIAALEERHPTLMLSVNALRFLGDYEQLKLAVKNGNITSISKSGNSYSFLNDSPIYVALSAFNRILEKEVRRTLSKVNLRRLEYLYPKSSLRSKSDFLFRDKARRATSELQAGDPIYRAIWKELVRVSRTALEREFDALGIEFDLWKGESDADPLLDEMASDLRAKGLLVCDQGAEIVRIAKENDKRQLPPLIVVSSEGSAMYGATDLATIVDRRQSQDPDLILYVVDQRQADHFEQVFRAAYLAGYAPAGSLEHIGFGTMNGTDGKPFKTREGGVLKLNDLIVMARDKARERLHEADLGVELSPEEFEATAHKVAVAALKFADLSNFRGTSYVFDLDRFTSFEGKTGPYLLYQAVRIKSLLRKAADAGAKAGEIAIAAPAERELALTLDAFDHATTEAYERRAPNLIAEHAYRLAQSFSKFYAACPVLAAATEAERGSRLALATVTLRQLEQALDLLGIETPERM